MDSHDDFYQFVRSVFCFISDIRVHTKNGNCFLYFSFCNRLNSIDTLVKIILGVGRAVLQFNVTVDYLVVKFCTTANSAVTYYGVILFDDVSSVLRGSLNIDDLLIKSRFIGK